MSSRQVHVPAAHGARRSRSMRREQPWAASVAEARGAGTRGELPGARAHGAGQRREQLWAGGAACACGTRSHGSEGLRKPAARAALGRSGRGSLRRERDGEQHMAESVPRESTARRSSRRRTRASSSCSRAPHHAVVGGGSIGARRVDVCHRLRLKPSHARGRRPRAMPAVAVENTFDLGTARASSACRRQARRTGRPASADTGSRDRLADCRGGHVGRSVREEARAPPARRQP